MYDNLYRGIVLHTDTEGNALRTVILIRTTDWFDAKRLLGFRADELCGVPQGEPLFLIRLDKFAKGSVCEVVTDLDFSFE